MIDAFPLQWPIGWARTPKNKQERARFDTNFSQTRWHLFNEIRLLSGRNPIISSNIPLRRDGLPYASYREPEDCGIAIYFHLDGNQECFPCDRWNRAVDNLHAIELSIKALRGLERWGAKDMVRAAFRGFKALPSSIEDNKKTEIDYFLDCDTKDELKNRFRTLSKTLHPDVNGNNEDFVIMMRQYERKKEMIR